ncbi:MAG: hypothetical protein MUQ27_08240 [Acidimicrobiia bacterium]|nr:hypothetical protein [Acidimicrobiia bacterium]
MQSRVLTALLTASLGWGMAGVGVVAGVVLLDEVLTVPILIGAVFALVGVAVAGRVRSPRPAVVG